MTVKYVNLTMKPLLPSTVSTDFKPLSFLLQEFVRVTKKDIFIILT